MPRKMDASRSLNNYLAALEMGLPASLRVVITHAFLSGYRAGMEETGDLAAQIIHEAYEAAVREESTIGEVLDREEQQNG